MRFTVIVKTAAGIETHKGVVDVDEVIASACIKYDVCAFSWRPE